MEDLAGTIYSLWNKYKIPGYNLEDATDDAYIAFRKAVAKDRLAPKIKKAVCPNCNHKFSPECPGDEIADHIYNHAPSHRVPTKRTILLKCECCNHKWHETVYKTKFSTHIYAYIRGEIQSSIRVIRCNDISMDMEIGEEGTMHDIIGTEDKKKETIPIELVNEIYKIIGGLSERHKETAALFYGIGGKGICDRKVTRLNNCHCCGEEFEVTIDYNLSVNFCTCPHCDTENRVDMCMNQTDIAKQFGISKQRIGSILNKINANLAQNLSGLVGKHELVY